MATISTSEVERVISAAKNRRFLDFRRPHSSEILANERKLGERIRAFLTKAGIEVEEIDKMLAENQSEWRRLLEKEKANAQKVLPRIEDTFRHGIDGRLKALELANFSYINPPTFVVLDTPLAILAQPPNILTASHIEPRNSTAQMRYSASQRGIEDFGGEDLTVSFVFRWENSSANPVLLANIASHLVVKGYWEVDAFNSFLPYVNYAGVEADAKLQLFEWWNQPPTSPLSEASQTTQILDFEAEGPAAGGRAQNTKYAWVFNGYDVKYSSLAVPPNGVVVFEVILLSRTSLIGAGAVDIEIEGGDYSILCPFLQFEASELIHKGPPL
jgi:hypothetical protein